VIVSESGRAIAAYHSVLVFNVLGVSGFGEDAPQSVPDDAEQPVLDLQDTYKALSSKNLLESFHDSQQALDAALNLFSLGLSAAVAAQSGREPVLGHLPPHPAPGQGAGLFPEELEGLDGLLSDTYFCNFSLFQSMPDSWAVKQLFPIMPIQPAGRDPHAQRRPGRHFCDSDGKIDQFTTAAT